MNEVSFPSTHNHLFDRDVIEFPAVVDGKAMVTCRITLEEMMQFMPGTTPASLEDIFQMLRPGIEERARNLILAKRKDSQ